MVPGEYWIEKQQMDQFIRNKQAYHFEQNPELKHRFSF